MGEQLENSVNKGAWKPEIDPLGTYGRHQELIPTSYLLHMHTYIEKLKMFKVR